jgi:ankyrin repeat protein
MHYQAAVAQFVATMIMTILRVVIRRHSSPRPVLNYNPCGDGNLNTFGIIELKEGHELNELAKRLTGCKEWTLCNGYIWNYSDFQEDFGSESVARKVLQNRLRLKELCGNFESVQTLADSVGDTIEAIMNYIWTTRLSCLEDDEQLHWTIEVATTGDVSSISKLDILLFRLGDKWQVERASIEAILGMWISHLYNHGQPDSENNLWLLSYDSDESCEFSQALLDLMNPNSVRLEPVSDIAEICRERQIDHRRVLCCGMTGTSQKTNHRAMIGRSGLSSMCAQYLIMGFLSQMAVYLQKPATPLYLEEDPKSHVTLVRDPIFDTIRSLIRQSGLATEEDSFIITFGALVQTGKLLDPLSLLPQLVNAAVLQKEDEASRTCSRICQLFKWNAVNLASKGLLVDASELGLSLIGTFTESFGYQHEETQKVRKAVQGVILAAESRNQIPNRSKRNDPQHLIHAIFPQGPAPDDLLVDIKQTTQIYEKELLVNSHVRPAKPLPEVQVHEIPDGTTQPPAANEMLDENAFKAIIRAGDVERVRRALLFDRAQYLTFLSNGIIAAFDSTNQGCTFEQTEIMRLLVLSGSGLDFGFRFNVTTLLSAAAQAGNIMLAKLLLGKTSKNHYRLDIFKALCTAIEFDHETFVKFLVDSGENFKIDDRKSSQALRHAAFHGRETIVKHLISLGVSVQGHPNDMENALSRAASKNHDILGKFLIEQELLISKGVGFHYQRGETSLHFVAAVGNMNLVQVLLDAGWDVNAGERDIPLKEALRHGHEQVANLLIEKGSRLEDGLLHQVAEKGLISTARLVISKGADVNALDRQKRPVLEAAREGPKDAYEGFVKFLIDNGANVDVKDSRGMPVLLQASEDGYEGVSKLFLEAGASLTKKRTDGTTVVHSAAKKGHTEVIRLLVEKGAHLDTRDNNMNTALNFAAAGGHTEVIRVLLKAKPGDWVNGNSVDEYRNPPLHDAIIKGHSEAARVLVENGASIADHSFVDWHYCSPLYIAVRNQKAEVVQIFMDMGGGTLKDSSFSEIAKDAIESGDLETIKALLSKETANPIKGKPSQATQHLPHAALRCKLDVVTLLLNLGADPSDNKALNVCIESSNNPNFTAANSKIWNEISKLLFLHNPAVATPLLPSLLRAATSRNNADGVCFWLSHNAPIDTRYEGGRTILHYAAAADAVECLAILLEVNAAAEFVNARAGSGATALHAAVRGVKMYAASESHLGVVKMLVAHGADPALRAVGDGQVWVGPVKLVGDGSRVVGERDQGFTPLDEARRANLGLIVKFLEGLERH